MVANDNETKEQVINRYLSGIYTFDEALQRIACIHPVDLYLKRLLELKKPRE